MSSTTCFSGTRLYYGHKQIGWKRKTHIGRFRFFKNLWSLIKGEKEPIYEVYKKEFND